MEAMRCEAHLNGVERDSRMMFEAPPVRPGKQCWSRKKLTQPREPLGFSGKESPTQFFGL
jgi:hypothetical protein